MTENPTVGGVPAAPAGPTTGPAAPAAPLEAPAATPAPEAPVEWPVLPEDAPAAATQDAAPAGPAGGSQSSLAAPRGLSYAVDIVFCIDVTGSMTPIIDAVKANALGFYDDVQNNLTAKGKNVAQLRVRVVAFRDFVADGAAALEESPFYALPDERNAFSEFVNGLIAEGGGDAAESGLEAVALAVNSPWTSAGDRRRQVIVVWTDQPAHTLDPAVVPADLASRVPADFSALTDVWEDEQGLMGSSSKRLILFAPDGPGWSDISAVWENVVHHPSQAGGGLSEVDYGTIIDSIGNSV
ncbi:MAG TPA: vWA domain-containing protein [Propionibacteriaceae bacterium]|nr:vWA domain-containing protein [Propionibacteriaceae bacterium]